MGSSYRNAFFRYELPLFDLITGYKKERRPMEGFVLFD